MSLISVFPGQGSQFVGMGKDFYDAFESARLVFGAVDEALGQHLSKMIFEGEDETLRLTANAQPALMAVSMAILESCRKEFGFDPIAKSSFVLGHSLGEYTALAAAGVISLEDTAKLLRRRGEAMQAAVPVGKGGMAAVIGAEEAAVRALCKDASEGGYYCAFANDNAPGQIVISGHKEAIERAVALGKERGIKRVVPLPVSAPFHSELMMPAARAMEEALASIEFSKPSVPVICNVSAQECSDSAMLKENLISQVVGSVRWRESILYAIDEGADKMVEIGAGKVLSGLAKRIDKSLTPFAAGTIEEVENLMKELA